MSCNALIIATTALIGLSLAPQAWMATLPLGLQWLAFIAAVMPLSLLMKRRGRPFGLRLAALAGIFAGGLGFLAVMTQSFGLYCLAALPYGVFGVGIQVYRFAAIDGTPPALRGQAVSTVVAGGVIAAVLGPELAKVSKEILAVNYAGAWLAIAALAAVNLGLLCLARLPEPSEEERHLSGRRLSVVTRSPVFLVAALAAVIGYGGMNLVMTATPLVMVGEGRPFETAATVIQFHILAMYAPSIFTGRLISRFGMLPVLMTGAVFLLCCAAVNLLGQGLVWQFALALVLLGVGWNFLFVGGTTLLAECHNPAEKAKIQGLNDFLVFGTVAITAMTAGALQEVFGWHAINLAILPPVALLLTILVCYWLAGEPGRDLN